MRTVVCERTNEPAEQMYCKIHCVSLSLPILARQVICVVIFVEIVIIGITLNIVIIELLLVETGSKSSLEDKIDCVLEPFTLMRQKDRRHWAACTDDIKVHRQLERDHSESSS